MLDFVHPRALPGTPRVRLATVGDSFAGSEPVTAPRAVVVGGGWAGLAAAVELARRGHAPTLLESAPRLGGRARTVDAPFGPVDNGQHLLIGAYRDFLGLLATLGVPEERAVARRNLTLRMSDLAGADDTVLAVPSLPAPLHLAKALGTARGLGLGERLAAVRFTAWLQKREFDIDDTPLGPLLAARGQPARVTRALWEPLCLATLNTPLALASARLFARVLQRTFTGHRSHCDLLLPRAPLGALLPEPAAAFLAAHGGEVRLGCRARGLRLHDGRVAGVVLDDGGEVPADHVVLALPPHAVAAVLADQPALADVRARAGRLDHQPICTVYLHYPEAVAIDGGLRGVLGGTTQWLVDRRDAGSPGLVAAVVSADGPHMALDRDALAGRVAAEAARIFPHWPAPRTSLVIREKRATFASSAGVEALRPGCTTPVPGCWLAGDWTATGLPATLEGAVASGVQSARAVAAMLDGRP